MGLLEYRLLPELTFCPDGGEPEIADGEAEAWELTEPIGVDHDACGRNSIRNRTGFWMIIPVTSGRRSISMWIDKVADRATGTSDLIHSALQYAPTLSVFHSHGRAERFKEFRAFSP